MNSILSPISIKSNIRHPNEYKYFYNNNNNINSDESFLSISTMWSNSLNSNYIFLSTNYTQKFTVFLYLNKQNKKYILYIYNNKIDYRNETINLCLENVYTIPLLNNNFNNNVNIYIASDNYLLLNEFENRILLIDIFTGNFITLFNNNINNNNNDNNEDLFYNIINTFDELYLKNGNILVRTYVFIYIKKNENNNFVYFYKYFIVEKGVFNNKNNIFFYLNKIEFNLGNSKPIDIKIAKISQNKKWFFIFIFLSKNILFQFITDYVNISLNKVFKQFIYNNNSNSMNDSINNKNNSFLYNIQTTFIESDFKKKDFIKIFLHININKFCSFIIYFNNNCSIIANNFNYNDSPQQISSKIFISNKVKLKSENLKLFNKYNIYNVNNNNNNSFKINSNLCAFNNRNLIFINNNKIIIFNNNNNNKISFNYDFYEEIFYNTMMFEGISCLFLISQNKIFKIIHNQNFEKYNEIFNNFNSYNNSFNYNNYNQKSFPKFKYNPKFIFQEYKKFFKNYQNFGFCEVCGKETKLKCKKCNLKYYCCKNHYKYDYLTFHFFDCEFYYFLYNIRFNDNNKNEQNNIFIYNEIIKFCNKILNFIFKRIYSKKDFNFYLNFILQLIKFLEIFSFKNNLEEFYLFNFSNNNNIQNNCNKIINILFYTESIFYYLNLQILKCIFSFNSNLYNLTDCYLKIIKEDLILNIIPKTNRHILSIINIKQDKINYNLFSSYFKFLSNFPTIYKTKKFNLFFDINNNINFINNNKNNNNKIINIIENFIIKTLYVVSIFPKFKIKLNSEIEISYLLNDFSLLFDEYFRTKNIIIAYYSYFSICYYFVVEGKILETIKLLTHLLKNLNDDKINYINNIKKMIIFIHFNLGILFFAIGDYKQSIHNLEISYKLFLSNNNVFFIKNEILLKIYDKLSLVYLNQLNLFKAYTIVQTHIEERKTINNSSIENQIQLIKLNMYLNYIIDLYEFKYIINKNNKNIYKNISIKNIVIDNNNNYFNNESEIEIKNLNEFIKIVKFIYNLPNEVLLQLQNDNTSNKTNNNNIINNNEKEEFENEIEINEKIIDNLNQIQKNEFQKIKNFLLFKREIILRDSLGLIEKFNINYHPIFSHKFVDVINKLNSNKFLKKIFYNEQNEKWIEEIFNVQKGNILEGLSRYLNSEKIKNVMNIEKCKIYNNYNNNFNNNINNKIDKLLKFEEFKEKCFDALNSLENKINLDDEILKELYYQVYLKNKNKNFIFENFNIIINNIYFDLNKKEINNNIKHSNNNIIINSNNNINNIVNNNNNNNNIVINNNVNNNIINNNNNINNNDNIKNNDNNLNESYSSSTIKEKSRNELNIINNYYFNSFFKQLCKFDYIIDNCIIIHLISFEFIIKKPQNKKTKKKSKQKSVDIQKRKKNYNYFDNELLREENEKIFREIEKNNRIYKDKKNKILKKNNDFKYNNQIKDYPIKKINVYNFLDIIMNNNNNNNNKNKNKSLPKYKNNIEIKENINIKINNNKKNKKRKRNKSIDVYKSNNSLNNDSLNSTNLNNTNFNNNLSNNKTNASSFFITTEMNRIMNFNKKIKKSSSLPKFNNNNNINNNESNTTYNNFNSKYSLKTVNKNKSSNNIFINKNDVNFNNDQK